MKKLIIDGNDIYEIDMECVKRKKNIDKCQIPFDANSHKSDENTKGGTG